MTEFKKEIKDLKQVLAGERCRFLVQTSDDTYHKQCPSAHHDSIDLYHYTAPRDVGSSFGSGHIEVGTAVTYIPWRVSENDRRTLVDNASGIFGATSITVDSSARFGVGEAIKVIHPDTGRTLAVPRITDITGSTNITVDREVTCPDNSVILPVYPLVRSWGENFIVQTQPHICIKVSKNGYYTVQAEIDMDFEQNLVSTQVVHYCLFKNGADQDALGLATLRELPSGKRINRLYTSGIVYLEAGDEVDFRIKKDSNTDTDITYCNHRWSMQMYAPE